MAHVSWSWTVSRLSYSFAPTLTRSIAQHNNSFGKHIWVLSANNTRVFLKILYFFEIFYTTAVCAVKLAM